MFTIQTKVIKAPFYNGEDFLIYGRKDGEAYRPLIKAEAEFLLEIFNNNPSIFIDPFIRELEDTTLIDIEDVGKRYNEPHNCEFSYLLESLKKDDKEKLLKYKIFFQGFNQKYIASKT